MGAQEAEFGMGWFLWLEAWLIERVGWFFVESLWEFSSFQREDEELSPLKDRKKRSYSEWFGPD